MEVFRGWDEVETKEVKTQIGVESESKGVFCFGKRWEFSQVFAFAGEFGMILWGWWGWISKRTPPPPRVYST